MPVRYSASIEQVEANRNRLAVTRGPLVYCAEQIDNGDEPVQRFYIENPDTKASVSTIQSGPLEGIVQLELTAMDALSDQQTTMTMIPYYAWNNRGDDMTMLVWMPRDEQTAITGIGTNVMQVAQFGTVSASHTYGNDTVQALIDGQSPADSFDNSIDRWTSWPQTSREQEITFDFHEPMELESVAVYWYDDQAGNGGVWVPQSWHLEIKVEGRWQPFDIYVTDFYATEKDMYNVVRPQEVLNCQGLKIVMQPQQDQAVGILDVILQAR